MTLGIADNRNEDGLYIQDWPREIAASVTGLMRLRAWAGLSTQHPQPRCQSATLRETL